MLPFVIVRSLLTKIRQRWIESEIFNKKACFGIQGWLRPMSDSNLVVISLFSLLPALTGFLANSRWKLKNYTGYNCYLLTRWWSAVRGKMFEKGGRQKQNNLLISLWFFHSSVLHVSWYAIAFPHLNVCIKIIKWNGIIQLNERNSEEMCSSSLFLYLSIYTAILGMLTWGVSSNLCIFT